MKRAVGRVACALLCAGCFGRSVVGELDPDGPTGVCEEDDLGCLDWGDTPEFPGIDPAVFEAPAPCSDALTEMRLGEDTPTATAPPIEVAGLDASCGTLRLTLAAGAREVTLLSPRIANGRLEISAEGTSTVTISGATGDEAYVVLEGTSVLRFRSLDGVLGWRIDAANGTRGWDLEIEDSDLRGAALRAGEDARILVRQTRLTDAQIEAGTLSLQGAMVEDSRLDARELIAAGTDLRGGDLQRRRGSFTSGSLEGARLYGCDSFLFLDTAVERSDIGPCDAGPLQLNNTSVGQSILRGRIFAVQTRFIECVIGREEGASVSLVDARIAYSLLCDVEAISARGGSVLTCARCAPGSPRAACIDEASSVTVVACPTVALATVCDAELPPSLTSLPDAGMSMP